MSDIEKYYFNHENFGEIIQNLKSAEEYMSSSYSKLDKLQSEMLGDTVWKNMGKDESIGFLNIILQMHKDISGLDTNDTGAAVPSMINSLNNYMQNMEEFYTNSKAYNNMINKQY